MNVNEAQAYASCYNCAAVAIAYQVVFVLETPGADDNDTDPTKDTNDNVAVPTEPGRFPELHVRQLPDLCVRAAAVRHARRAAVGRGR